MCRVRPAYSGGFGTAIVCYPHAAICGEFLDRGALVIEFPCLYCGQSVRREEGLSGKHIECPTCGHSVMVRESKGWLLIFPAWNILNAGLLLLLFRLGVAGTDGIIDEQAGLAQVVITAICIPVLLTVCRYWFELHWAVTFSIAVAYTLSLHNGIRAVFGVRRPAPRRTQDP